MDTNHLRELRTTTLIYILFEQIFSNVARDATCKTKRWKCSGLGNEFQILACRVLLKFLGKGICWDVMSCLETGLRSIE